MLTRIFKTVSVLGLFATAPMMAQQGPLVHSIAPSASTKRESQRIIRLCRWTDTSSTRDADAIMVVVRTSSANPMAPSYDSLKWLIDEASSLANDTGAQFHVYFYVLTPRDSFQQVSHRAYDVPGSESGTGIFPDLLSRANGSANAGLSCGF